MVRVWSSAQPEMQKVGDTLAAYEKDFLRVSTLNCVGEALRRQEKDRSGICGEGDAEDVS